MRETEHHGSILISFQKSLWTLLPEQSRSVTNFMVQTIVPCPPVLHPTRPSLMLLIPSVWEKQTSWWQAVRKLPSLHRLSAASMPHRRFQKEMIFLKPPRGLLTKTVTDSLLEKEPVR